MFASCGPNREEIKEEGPNRAEIKEEERIRMEVIEELEEEKRIEAKRKEAKRKEAKRIEEELNEFRKSIPQKEWDKLSSSTIIIEHLEVMKEDLGLMYLNEAKKACADLGDGWRLPTKDELNLLYENKDKIGGFESCYWSSTEIGNGGAWEQSFEDGKQRDFNEIPLNYVRAVRSK